MAIHDDVLCYNITVADKGMIVCLSCADKYLEHITEKDIVTEDHIESGEAVFCDDCERKIY